MASSNPTLTPQFNLPSPKPADPPDVPGDIEALADRVEEVLLLNTVQQPYGQTRFIEWGLNIVATPSSDQFTNDSITFRHTFANPPVVVASSSDSRVNAAVTGISTTTAQLSVRALDGQNLPGGNTTVFWIVLGQGA